MNPTVVNLRTDGSRSSAGLSKSRKNIGIACGPARLLVLDLDGPDQTGPYADVLAGLGVDEPTYTVATPRGEHRYYHLDAGTPGLTTVGRLAAGVDTRAAGGYVVAAGSIRGVGGRAERYRVVSPPDVPVRPAPRRLLDALASRSRDSTATTLTPCELPIGRRWAYVRAAVTGEVGRVVAASPGCRNASLFTAALRLGRLAAAGLLDETEVVALLGAACENHLGVDGFTAAEADRAIGNGLRYSGSRSPGPTGAQVRGGS